MPPESLDESGLTLTQFAVLEALYHLGPDVAFGHRAKVLTTGGNLTMVVGNLEKQGLARRQSCPEDKRVLIVVLTAKGKLYCVISFPKHAAAIVEYLSVLIRRSRSAWASSAGSWGNRNGRQR